MIGFANTRKVASPVPTTARGIWTPSDTDAVDFTTHLATMAGTIDTALTNLQNAVGAGANAYRGTAAQRAAFLATAVVGQLWQDTDSITMLWKKVGAAWVPAVWRWQGTTAQMNAFTVAPNGFSWFNTTDNSEYVRLAGVWKATTTPWAHQSIGTGAADYPAPPAGTIPITKTGYVKTVLSGGVVPITFPGAFPTKALYFSAMPLEGTAVSPVINTRSLSPTGVSVIYPGAGSTTVAMVYMAIGF